VAMHSAGESSGDARVIDLVGGRTLTVRPMREMDADGFDALYRDLSEDDRYRRFFSGVPAASRLRRLVGPSERTRQLRAGRDSRRRPNRRSRPAGEPGSSGDGHRRPPCHRLGDRH
jgi:hypothetical protein